MWTKYLPTTSNIIKSFIFSHCRRDQNNSVNFSSMLLWNDNSRPFSCPVLIFYPAVFLFPHSFKNVSTLRFIFLLMTHNWFSLLSTSHTWSFYWAFPFGCFSVCPKLNYLFKLILSSKLSPLSEIYISINSIILFFQ